MTPVHDDGPDPGPGGLAARMVSALSEQRQTVALAESLTGGLLSAALVEIPGASTVLRGAVVAYATELKHQVLGVDARLLAERGPVDPYVAIQMAAGTRRVLGADWGLSTTGVAGPGPQDGVPARRAVLHRGGRAVRASQRAATRSRRCTSGGQSPMRAPGPGTAGVRPRRSGT